MLNKQGPGKIDWTDYTWNPISGKCHHNCPYCYMHSFWKRYPKMAKPQLKQKYLEDKFPKKPSRIFMGSSTDMWGDWVPGEWIERVIYKAWNHHKHTFQFLTKNPLRYSKFDLSLLQNCWFGTTFDGTSKTINNIIHLIKSVPGNFRFVSFEPLLEDPWPIFPHMSSLDWIIIGADSTKGASKPPKVWADHLIECAKHYDIPIFIKDNYGYPEIIKEFPEIGKKGIL